MMYPEGYDPFREYRLYGAPRMQQQRCYRKPTIIRMQRQPRYNPEQDMNQTARMVIGGAVIVGTLGLLGNAFDH